MKTNQNDDLDFKINLGLVIFGRFSDIQKLKEFLEEHPELIVRYQCLDKGRITINREGDAPWQQ